MALTDPSGNSEIKLGMLMDSGSAITCGHLDFHIWLLAHYPEYVHSFEAFNDLNPFEPIKLLGAVSNINAENTTQGNLTAVIRYYINHPTPSTGTKDKPMILTVALGKDVEVNTLIGWPTWLLLGLNLLTTEDVISSEALANRFKIHRKPTQRGLPKNVKFDVHEFLHSDECKQILGIQERHNN